MRRKNFVRPDEFPWEVGTESAQTPVVYDSGEYAAGLDRALELSDYAKWRSLQAAEGTSPTDGGRLSGIGLAAYVMLTGLGPHESSLLRVDPSGKLTLITGASPHGQGTATALAQLVAMLTLGTALPHALRGLGAEFPWQSVITASSVLALLGAGAGAAAPGRVAA